MSRQPVEVFKYFSGIHSLADIATKRDRVCVLNILGTESRTVTPTSHSYSGGNVVFGTSPGRCGETLSTSSGAIPVYSNVRGGLEAGHQFNAGVVYLPPAAVRDGVFELIRVNEQLEKIVIVTEKVPVHDAREIRALAQARHVDVFGANCLGVADAWNHVRFGGALGGESPEETLVKGSVAIYSNSGNFTTTIANYLKTAGWGTTTSISSGKDFYIFFGPAEFSYALANDERSKCAVMYIEPGGYYEQDLGLLSKPTVACVVGKWKSKLKHAVGHAGALAGDGDNAEAKERWFMRRFAVNGIFTPEMPVFSERGAVVADISHVPAALTAVMKLNGIDPDFEGQGDLSLKPWFGSNAGVSVPVELDLKLVEPLSPYDQQIATLSRQIGAIFPRQSMRNASAFSIMDSETQVTRISGVPVLDAATEPLEANLCLALVRQRASQNDRELINLTVAAKCHFHDDVLAAVTHAARQAGNAPNTVIASAIALIGPTRVKAAMAAAETLTELFAQSGMKKADAQFDFTHIRVTDEQKQRLVGNFIDKRAEALIEAFKCRGARSSFIDFLLSLDGYPTADAVMAALTTTVAWDSLMKKLISRTTVTLLPWYVELFGTVIGAAIESSEHQADSLCGVKISEILQNWSVTDLAYLALAGRQPADNECFLLQALLGLLISNGPGTISATGCKGAVSADGPETPERVQINKAMIGFLTHTGFAHGGNGFEGIQFLLDRFNGVEIDDPGTIDENLELTLTAIADQFADHFKREKAARKAVGEKIREVPCINHPVFKGKSVNTDPREEYIYNLFQRHGQKNVFHEFYRKLVQALFDSGATANVFCVNIDGVIAALLLKLLWHDYKSGKCTQKSLADAAFTAFLIGRMVGCAGEIDDHINRGKNMDMRVDAASCSFVS